MNMVDANGRGRAARPSAAGLSHIAARCALVALRPARHSIERQRAVGMRGGASATADGADRSA